MVLNDDGEPVEVEGTDVEEDELTPMPASRRHGVEVEEDDVVQQTTPLPSVGGGGPTAPAPAPQPRIISLPPPLGRAASGSPMASGGGQSSHHATRSAAGVPRFGEQQMTFTAPAVLGETACLGNFPYCATVRVESDVAVVATISRADYALLVASTGLLELQRTLLYEALREREVFMPFFAPLCRGRLRMCPLFSHVSDAVLDELREAAIPRVFPAGMLISEGENPKHVFFVRRGQVRREPDPKGYRDGTEVHCERLRNQALLVEGHTFGELPCAFRESTRDTYYAISNTDIYALPYATLELLMRSHPEVKLQLEAGAMALYESRGVAVPGLKFTPTLTDPRHYVDGVFPKDAMLLTLYKKAVLDQRLLAPGASGPSSRRVTIMDAGGVASLDGTLNGGVPTLHGGKVTPGMTEAIQLIPLLSLVTPPSFNQRCLALWKCTQYREGDVIVRRGEECNRVLFFYHGSSGVVMDERGYLVEGANRKTVVTIPKGQMVGYTCVRRHRWTRSIVCLQNLTEVWELKRSALVSLLQQFDCAEAVNTAVLQVLQPLCPILPEYSSTPGGRKSGGTTTVNNTMISSSGSGGGGGGASGGTAAAEELQRQQRESRRFLPLDSQPLLRPMLNSLWGSQPVPNLHPVSMNPTPLPLFPVWKPGDFPLSSSAADSSGGAAANRRSFSSRRMSYQVVQSLSQQNSLTNLNSNDLRSPSAQRQGNNTGEWVEVGEDRHRRSTGEGSELANTQRPAASKRNPDLRRGGERPHGANAHDDEVEAANAVLPPPVDRNVTVAPNGNLSILHEDGLQQFGGAVDNTSFSL